MRISTAPWEDAAADLDAGTRGETSPVFSGSRSDFGFPASDLPFSPEIWRFSGWGGTAWWRGDAERREAAFLPAHRLANRVRVSALIAGLI
jgi:hypothetical protein